jgi:hypothetical protein
MISNEHITWMSHVFFSQLDATTAEKAANALNESWCKSDGMTPSWQRQDSSAAVQLAK